MPSSSAQVSAAKLLVDTGMQIFNPFLEIITLGLGTNIVVMGVVAKVLAPWASLRPSSAVADRRGYRPVMQPRCSCVGAAGLIVVGLSRTWMAAFQA
ncbi:MAG: hypothetical protein R2838_26185 [Caldilineaceae bacterium]